MAIVTADTIFGVNTRLPQSDRLRQLTTQISMTLQTTALFGSINIDDPDNKQTEENSRLDHHSFHE
jgi:ABC-type transporter Mla maintaining outer membrane lipid asymmetry ATPase subunit MlaF